MADMEIVERSDEVVWVRLTGVDYGTNITFDSEVFGIAGTEVVLDYEGCPLTAGDRDYIAVNNSIVDLRAQEFTDKGVNR